MKLVVLNGSRRTRGDTQALLDLLVENAVKAAGPPETVSSETTSGVWLSKSIKRIDLVHTRGYPSTLIWRFLHISKGINSHHVKFLSCHRDTAFINFI